MTERFTGQVRYIDKESIWGSREEEIPAQLAELIIKLKRAGRLVEAMEALEKSK